MPPEGCVANVGMNARVLLYDGILKELRRLMVERMVKPEEVLITADEHGNVVRDVVKDTDLQQQYKTMRETLVYLSHLDHADTEMQMLDKLRMQLDGEEWQWDRLNTLCWVRDPEALVASDPVWLSCGSLIA